MVRSIVACVVALAASLVAVAADAQPRRAPSAAQVVARFRRMTAAQFAALVPDAGFSVCSGQGENEAEAESRARCEVVTRAQVTDASWASTLRDRVWTSRRVRCHAQRGGTERCEADAMAGEPPHGQAWYFTGTGASRRLLRVFSWSIDG